MIDTIIDWDKKLFLFLNGIHSDFWDVVMFNISNKLIWIPFYVLILYLITKHYKKDTVWILLAVVVLVTLSDQLSVHGFKNVFMRLRPCHDPDLAGLVHIVNDKCGGQFGFYSSHASNHFALAAFFSFLFSGIYKYSTIIFLLWAGIISYSRIYLGVHFPLDVFFGGIAGTGLALAVSKIYFLARRQFTASDI